MEKYDLVVIGSGPAGEKAAVKAAYFGHKVALIEKETVFGGAVVNTGTLPSKTLKETALYLSGKYEKGLYGKDKIARESKSLENFLYRQRLVSSESNKDVENNLKKHNVSIYLGTASLIANNIISIDNKNQIFGEKILIATGSYPVQPKHIPFDGVLVHDSDSILRLQKLPESICIVGAGVIGCEYATIFAAMGTKVFLVNSVDKILSFLDRETSSLLLELMQRDGIETHLGQSLESVVLNGEKNSIKINLQNGISIDSEMFLFAAGRSGRISDLNCDKVGIETGKRETIMVNEKYQTSVPNIYAVGDVIGFPALASTSMDQGRVAVSHMFNLKDVDSIPKLLCYGIYTIPEVSMVGLTEEAANDQRLEYFVGRASYSKIPRGRILGAQSGQLKLIFCRKSNKLLGVHIIGNMAAELIHFGMGALDSQKNVHELIGTVFNFPTLHELYKYASFDALGNLSGHKIKDH